MKLLDGHIMCDVDGCSSTNEYTDIIRFLWKGELREICQNCMHLYVRPIMEFLDVVHKEKEYGKDK